MVDCIFGFEPSLYTISNSYVAFSTIFRPVFAILGLLLLLAASFQPGRPAPPRFEVIAYYAGNGEDLDRYRFDQLTQVIFSFCHLRGDELAVDNAGDSIAIRKLVALKRHYPHLRIMLSLGGWCGCQPCSEVFSRESGRQTFATSVRHLLRTYGADGIDLDWEYPGIEGCPGHPWMPEDRAHFTALVQVLRKTLGNKYGISFAAGGFQSFFDHSIDWAKVMPFIDRVNLMTYDIVNGFSTATGHHTALYATPEQPTSADYAVRYLDSLGVPRKKMVLGAAFYARTWVNVESNNRGLYQPGTFRSFVNFNRLEEKLSAANGFTHYRDTIAKAPYAYSPLLREFATYDDPESIAEKTRYALTKGLGGIMFWELTGDRSSDGLLHAIDQARKRKRQ